MFYPIILNIDNRLVTVFGAGEVAFRKVNNLLDYDVKIRVIAPKINNKFLTIKNRIEIIYDYYSEKYIKDSFIVIAATSDFNINKKIGLDCKKHRILCNIIDNRELSDFLTTSTVSRGSLKISISTLGKSPSLSSKIKKELEELYPQEYKEYVDLLGEIRKLVLKKCDDIRKRKAILNEIVNLNLDDLKSRRKEYENCSRI